MKQKNRRSFTLLEIMISIFLLGVVSIYLSNRFYSYLEDYNFKKNISLVKSNILFCHNMAQTHQTDIFLWLTNNTKGLTLKMGTDKDRGIFFNENSIEKKLKKINFSFNDKDVKKLRIVFSSTGNFFPKGDILIYKNDKKEELSLSALMKIEE